MLNFAKALSKIVLVCCHTQGNRCCKALSPTTGRKWGLRKRNYPLSPTWQVRGQTCSLLAEQETCFLSLLGLLWPWLPASRFESEMKQMLRQGRKCFASLLHREGESVRWYEAENRVLQRRTYQTMLWWCGDLLQEDGNWRGRDTVSQHKWTQRPWAGTQDRCHRKRSHWNTSFSSTCLWGSVNLLTQSRPWTKAKDLSRNSKPCTKMILDLEQKKGTLREFKERAHAPRWLLSGYFERRLGHISPLCFSQGPFPAWFLSISVFQSFGAWKS